MVKKSFRTALILPNGVVSADRYLGQGPPTKTLTLFSIFNMISIEFSNFYSFRVVFIEFMITTLRSVDCLENLKCHNLQ